MSLTLNLNLNKSMIFQLYTLFPFSSNILVIIISVRYTLYQVNNTENFSMYKIFVFYLNIILYTHIIRPLIFKDDDDDTTQSLYE